MEEKAVVGIVMGSMSDYEGNVSFTCETLESFGIPYEKIVLSAHRTPDETIEYAKTAYDRGLKVIIAAAGGAAHLAGVIAGCSTLPVIGIPMKTSTLDGLDSRFPIVQMPGGVPVATVRSARPDAKTRLCWRRRAGAFDPEMHKKIEAHKADMKKNVLENMKF